jgi:hypothetical protein
MYGFFVYFRLYLRMLPLVTSCAGVKRSRLRFLCIILGHGIFCFKKMKRLFAAIPAKVANDALYLLRLAGYKNEHVTVSGVLCKDAIDIKRVSCDGMSVRLDIDISSVFYGGLEYLGR